MSQPKLPALNAVACCVLLLLAGTVNAQSEVLNVHHMQARLETLSQELADQKALLADLVSFRHQYFEQSVLL